MPKKRLATRIDLDYNRNLRYPDVNEFLKDSMYASNLTEFPDNPENTITFFRAVPNTITKIGTTISVGTNLTLKPFLSTFKLYGYIGTLEAVDRMELEFDFLNEGDPEKTKKYSITKAGGAFDLDITQNSEIKGLKLPTIVNFSVFFPISSLVTVFNHVFQTRWKEAYAYYLNDVVLDAELDANSALYSMRLWLFLRENLYTLDIPAKINIFYVDAAAPAAVISTTITLDNMLPQYRGVIDLSTSVVDYNINLGASLNAFKFSFRPGAVGKLRIKGYFTGSPDKFEEDPEIAISKLEATEYTSAIMAKKYVDAQHGSYDIAFPELTFTYDFFINEETTPIIDDFLFDKFKGVPRYQPVKGLIMESYQFGHTPKKENSTFKNPFKLSLTFISNSNKLAEDIYRYKFQLSFKSFNESRPDLNPVLFDTTQEMAFIYGDFLSDSRKSRTVTTKKELYGSTRVNLASATQVGASGFLVYSQRTSNKNDVLLSSSLLVQCSVKLTNLGEDISGTRYRLDIVWPDNLNDRGLYLIAKCSYIELAISDYFQSVVHSGQIKKASYDTYYDDTTNPLYASVVHFPKFTLTGFNGLRQVSTSERNQLRQAGNSKLFDWTAGKEVKVQPIDFSGKPVRSFSYTLQNYLKGSDRDPKCTSPYFMDKGWVILAHQLKDRFLTYMLDAQFIRKLSSYYTSYEYDSKTNSFTVTFAEKTLQLAAKSIMGKPANKPLPVGTYYVYIATGLSEIISTDTFKLFTLSYAEPKPDNKFYTNVILQYTFEVK